MLIKKLKFLPTRHAPNGYMLSFNMYCLLVDESYYVSGVTDMQQICLCCWLSKMDVAKALIPEICELYQLWRNSRCLKFQIMWQDKLNNLLQLGYDLSMLFVPSADENFKTNCVFSLDEVFDIIQSQNRTALRYITVYSLDDADICYENERPHARMTAGLRRINTDCDFWQRAVDERGIDKMGMAAMHYAIAKGDHVIAQWLISQGMNVKAEVLDIMSQYLYETNNFETNFLQKIDINPDEYAVDDMLDHLPDKVHVILQKYNLANLTPRQKAKLLMRIVVRTTTSVQDMQNIYDAIAPLDWDVMTPDFTNMPGIIYNKDILYWCVANDWPYKVLRYSIFNGLKGRESEYLPFFRTIQTILSPETVSHDLSFMLSKCHDLTLMDILIQEKYLDIDNDLHLIINALGHVLARQQIEAAFASDVQHAMVSYIKLASEKQLSLILSKLCHTMNAKTLTEILDAAHLMLDTPDIFRLIWSFHRDVVKIFSHKACSQIDWNHKVTIQEVLDYSNGDTTKDRWSRCDFHNYVVHQVTSGLDDISILEFALIFGYHGNLRNIFKWIIESGIHVEWQRFNAYYTYYLDMPSDMHYPPDHVLRRLVCAHDHPECFYTRLFSNVNFGLVADFMHKLGILDARIATIRTETKSASKNSHEDAFNSLNDESDIPEEDELCEKFSNGQHRINTSSDDDSLIISF